MDKPLEIAVDLCQVFPDIEGELCSRHSILMGKLKNTFAKIYDNLEPTHYTVLKGVLSLYNQHEVQLSMALQNGVTLMSRGLDPQDQIYINSNHFGEEIIFTAAGKLEQGLNEYCQQIATAIRLGGEGVNSLQLKGAILYLHSNIVENCFNEKQILLISIFLAVALINGTLQKYSIGDLIEKLQKYGIFGSRPFLISLFGYQNRKFTLVVKEQHYHVELQKANKLVLCQVDLAKMDIKFQHQRQKQLGYLRDRVLRKVKQEWKLDSILQILQLQEQQIGKLSFREQLSCEQQPMSAQDYVRVSLDQLGMLSAFNNGDINFQQLVSAQWQLNSKHWKIHPEEVIQLIQQIKQTLGINSCMIINDSYALIVADKAKYAELLVFLRQKLHKGELKSKSLFKIEEELVQHRWSSDKNIGEKMFTSVPSCGVSIYDPSEAIWFD